MHVFEYFGIIEWTICFATTWLFQDTRCVALVSNGLNHAVQSCVSTVDNERHHEERQLPWSLASILSWPVRQSDRFSHARCPGWPCLIECLSSIAELDSDRTNRYPVGLGCLVASTLDSRRNEMAEMVWIKTATTCSPTVLQRSVWEYTLYVSRFKNCTEQSIYSRNKLVPGIPGRSSCLLRTGIENSGEAVTSRMQRSTPMYGVRSTQEVWRSNMAAEFRKVLRAPRK